MKLGDISAGVDESVRLDHRPAELRTRAVTQQSSHWRGRCACTLPRHAARGNPPEANESLWPEAASPSS